MTFHKFLSNTQMYTGNKNWFVQSGLSLNQREIVDMIHNSSRSVILKKRQDGVSTVLSLYLLWRMLETPGITIGLISNSRSNRDIYRQNINRNINKLQLGLEPRYDNMAQTEFKNGSRIFYISANTIDALRGREFDILLLEDFFESELRSKNSHKDVLTQCLYSIRPNNGKIIISTTENVFCDKLEWFKTLKFQKIYGHFFNGKREVLIEKLSIGKTF